MDTIVKILSSITVFVIDIIFCILLIIAAVIQKLGNIITGKRYTYLTNGVKYIFEWFVTMCVKLVIKLDTK